MFIGPGCLMFVEGIVGCLNVVSMSLTYTKPLFTADMRPFTNIAIMRRDMIAIGNRIISRGNRPVVNTGIVIRNAAGNVVASLSNGFSLRYPMNSALGADCVNCLTQAIGMAKGVGTLGVALGRSARALSRMIIINCNAVGGSSLANSITSIGTRRVVGQGPIGLKRNLRKTTTNMSIVHSSNSPRKNFSVHVHNITAIGNSTSPLCMISNIRMKASVSFLGPGSMRSVRVLGSTSTATVCNAHNTGNIVVVAAGGNNGKGTGIGFSTGCTLRFGSGGVSITSTNLFTDTMHSTIGGSNVTVAGLTCNRSCVNELGDVS